MLKRVGYFLVILLLVFVLVACSSPAPTVAIEEPVNTESSSVSKTQASTITPTATPTAIPTATPTVLPVETTPIQYEISYSHADICVSNWVINSNAILFSRGIAGITNTGSKNLFVASGSFDFTDATGALLETLNVFAYPEVIQPGETSYMYSETMYFGEQPLDVVIIVSHENVAEATEDCVRLPISGAQLKNDEYLGFYLIGSFENNIGTDLECVRVAAVIKDEKGTPLLIVSSDFYEVIAGDKTEFYLKPWFIDLTTVDSISSFEVYAYPISF